MGEREDAAEKWVFDTNGHKWSNNDNTAGDNYGSFIEGAKWESERMYSEEDLKKAFNAGRKQYSKLTWGDDFVDEWTWSNFKEWFTKFKEKK